jgi:hypothetical protein
MSLLINRDYANTGKPLWLPTSGGTISGNLTVNGNITATGDIVADGEVNAVDSLRVIDSNAATKFSFANDGAGNSLIQSTDVIKFTRLGTPNGNTQLTLSSAGANTDNLTVGGTMNCLIGPVPAQAITSSKTVNPVSTSAPADQYGVDNTITGISGAEYDIQAIATVFVVSGVPAADDIVNVNITIGGGQGNMSALVFPGETGGALGGFGVSGVGPLVAAGAAATCYMRARLTPNASGTTLGGNVLATLGGGSTAVYGSTLTILDVQRVR